jgi:hypothetical protein
MVASYPTVRPGHGVIFDDIAQSQMADNIDDLDARVKAAQAGALGRGKIVANSAQSVGTTVLDVVSASAVTPSSALRLLKVSANWAGLVGTVTADLFQISIQEGATVLAAQDHRIDITTTSHKGGSMMCYIESPTAAAHTYKLTIVRTNGTGLVTVVATATKPCQILVEDVGLA